MKRAMERLFLSVLVLTFFVLAGCSGESVLGEEETLEEDGLAGSLRQAAIPLTAEEEAYDALLDLVGDAPLVLLGEATHGTDEFYRERIRITQRLVQEKGFTAVAIEGDWPDAYRVNEYVRGTGGDASPAEALSEFDQFPTWMWRNTAVVDLLSWLRSHNQGVAPERQVGFYGLDLYSLYPSMEAVVGYLEAEDPAAAARVRAHYDCFDPYGQEPQAYGQAAAWGGAASCRDEAALALEEVETWAAARPQIGEGAAAEDLLALVQNARVVESAEGFYRGLYEQGVSTWNLRDLHMAETVQALLGHLDANGRSPKVVIWAHNSHVGDARATDRAAIGEWNIGQLLRQQYGEGAVLVGFTTFTGTVRAASSWGRPPELKDVRPALSESYEALLHAVGLPAFLLTLREGSASDLLRPTRLERAIGVIYLPERERASHYFSASLSAQFDALVHLDQTQAVQPLEPATASTAVRAPQLALHDY